MGISVYNIKRWRKMLLGKSVLHVNQGIGKVFVPGVIKGYFNDMTEKVILQSEFLENDDFPTLEVESGENVYFPTAIFQYGLGCYDFYLLTSERKYYNKFLQCSEWAKTMQEDNGAWNNFFYIYPKTPYCSMAQGEGASLLIRAYKETGDESFLFSAKKAIDFMLSPIESGGTADYANGFLILKEFTHRCPVFNGWIFSLFGLYDYTLVQDNKEYKDKLFQTISTLKDNLAKMDCGYWSMYDFEGTITSPFYHNLHIAQMEALFKITSDDIFLHYYNKFKSYQDNWIKAKKAFVKKAFQKIVE